MWDLFHPFNQIGASPKGSACTIEALEPRELLSASPSGAHSVTTRPAAALHTSFKVASKAPKASKATKPAKTASPAKAPAKAPTKSNGKIKTANGKLAAGATGTTSGGSSSDSGSTTPAPRAVIKDIHGATVCNCLGAWSGTFGVNPSPDSGTFSVNFTQQKGVSATGTFALGGMASGASVLTTVTVDSHGNFLALIEAPTTTVSLVGAISADGNVIVGRWCSQGTGVYQVGNFMLSR